MIEIIRFDHQGRGIGKINNKIIFVKNTIPGEIVDVKITKEKKNYLEGQVINIIKKSKKRIKPICPYFTFCGGCQLMHLPYNEQLKYKQNKVEDIIHKFTDKSIKINNIIECKNIYNYRNKATIHIANKIGFYKENTKELIDINSCFLVNNKINNTIKKLKYNKLKRDELIIRTNGKDTLIQYQNPKNIILNEADNIIIKSKVIKGKNYIIEKLNNLKFIVSPSSFFQINTEQTIVLYGKIKELANIKKSDNILDLYCGTGTIGLYLSKNCNKVLGVEINEEAIIDANKNKKLNNIQNAEFVAGDAKKVIKKISFKPDIIIVDPPRNGLFKTMIEDLLNFNAKKIIYVSCDPITLARDLKELMKKYIVKTIQPIDMFPNTYHIENVVLLEKM